MDHILYKFTGRLTVTQFKCFGLKTEKKFYSFYSFGWRFQIFVPEFFEAFVRYLKVLTCLFQEMYYLKDWSPYLKMYIFLPLILDLIHFLLLKNVIATICRYLSWVATALSLLSKLEKVASWSLKATYNRIQCKNDSSQALWVPKNIFKNNEEKKSCNFWCIW